MTFEELYKNIVEESITGKENKIENFEPVHLDCLLHPEKHPPVIRTEPCNGDSCNSECIASCIFDAFVTDENGNYKIDPELCCGCSACIDACPGNKLAASRDILPAMKAVRESKGPAYALIAPAFIGQFSEEVTPGMLRSCFKALGFEGMVEVALFADILTMKEALEFEKNINTDTDFQLTSCCCPIWIAMIRKIYNELMPHVPGAVSPMIACGRAVKALHPDAVTIFIGPCIAKKSEARETDISDAIDFVLTFSEVNDIFEAAGITPMDFPDNEKYHSSAAGIIYARTGGVSEAVKSTVEKLAPNKKIKMKTRTANGVSQCRKMIESLKNGELTENFFEGMGCNGGCVGGPKAIIDAELGAAHVNNYAALAEYKTPPENPYVIELLKRLGFNSIEEFLENSDMFNRYF